MRLYLLVTLLVVMTGLFLCPRSAYAQQPPPPPPPQPSAAHLKKEGDALFDKERFAEAYDAYRRAYAAKPDAALLYNQARALESMGEYPEALDKLEQFSKEASPSVKNKVPQLDTLMRDLGSRISTIHITTNVAGARLIVRDKDLGAIERDHQARTRAGDASIRLEAPGYQTWTKTVKLAGGGVLNVDAQLSPEPSTATSTVPAVAAPADSNAAAGGTAAVPPDTRSDRGGGGGGAVTSKWWFWTIVGAVVIGGGITAAVLITNTEKDPVQGDFTGSPIRVSAIRF
jgi:hypothetical protein